MVREPPRQRRATWAVLALLVTLLVGSLAIGLALSR
jgi:hypothetical protein